MPIVEVMMDEKGEGRTNTSPEETESRMQTMMKDHLLVEFEVWGSDLVQEPAC
jgi:hypothetical protein